MLQYLHFCTSNASNFACCTSKIAYLAAALMATGDHKTSGRLIKADRAERFWGSACNLRINLCENLDEVVEDVVLLKPSIESSDLARKEGQDAPNGGPIDIQAALEGCGVIQIPAYDAMLHVARRGRELEVVDVASLRINPTVCSAQQHRLVRGFEKNNSIDLGA